MRLLNAKTRQLEEFIAENVTPRYAILSHTWGSPKDEVKLQELEHSEVEQKPGYQKIEYCCLEALREDLEWVWVDTCCIDKTSSAELSEAINSMYRWYQRAKICYVYLADVNEDPIIKAWKNHDWAEKQKSGPSPENSTFVGSRWFTRGWTLQELLAPSTVRFYSNTFKPLGDKDELRFLLSFITGVPQKVILDSFYPSLSRASVGERMSWAAWRETTRVEDIAYCLLGLFDINMPLIYGEGRKAFRRLQEEIMKTSNDQTLFAWGTGRLHTIDPVAIRRYLSQDALNRLPMGAGRCLFASSPSDFVGSEKIVSRHSWHFHPGQDYSMPPTLMGRGIRIELPIFSDYDTSGKLTGRQLAAMTSNRSTPAIAVLNCDRGGKSDHYRVGIPLVANSDRFWRSGDLVGVRDVNSDELEKRTKILYIE